MAKEKYYIKNGDIQITPVKPNKEDFSKWEIIWEAYEMKGDKRKVAVITFAGEPEAGTVELLVSVEEGFKLHAYAKDAVRTMLDWALDQKNIFEVKCEVSCEDEVITDAVQRAGFVYRSTDRVKDYYTVDKQRTAWTALYIFIGFVAGLIIGVTIGHMVVGLVIGLIVGTSIGGVMDAKAMEERAHITGHSYIAHFKRAKAKKDKKHVEEEQEQE